MRKEIIISILIGLAFGLVITYGFYQAQVVSTEDVTKKEEIEVSQPSSPVASNGKLILLAPEDELVTQNKVVTVSGTTNPGSFIVIFVNNEPQTLIPNDEGKFTFDVELKTGPHIITVHALDDTGETVTESRTVIVQPTPSTTELEATESAETTTLTPTKKP
jgi:hypothetical protein